MLYVICYMLYVICYMLYVICYMLYVICYMLYVICYMLYKEGNASIASLHRVHNRRLCKKGDVKIDRLPSLHN